VGKFDIESLSMIIYNSALMTLLSPPASNIGGQYFFGSLQAFSQTRISVLVSSPLPGKFTNWIFLGYNSSGQLRRYLHYKGQIRVYDGNTDVPSFPSFSNWPMAVGVSLKRLEESRFQLAVINSSKKTVTDIQIEFVDPDGSLGYLLSGITRKRISALRPMGALAFCFMFVSLDRTSYPVLKATVAGREYLSDLSVFLHHYDLLRDMTPD
jgi:hypothetical protein